MDTSFGFGTDGQLFKHQKMKMNPKNKISVFALVVVYAIVNYIGYIYKFDFINNYLVFIKDTTEFKKNGFNIIHQFNILYTPFNDFIIGLNFHIFIICLVIQYKISSLLNGNSSLKLLFILLISIFVIRHTSRFLSLSDHYILRWFGLNALTRSLQVYNFLLYFPSMPFLIFIFNKSLVDKLKIISKQK